MQYIVKSIMQGLVTEFGESVKCVKIQGSSKFLEVQDGFLLSKEFDLVTTHVLYLKAGCAES